LSAQQSIGGFHRQDIGWETLAIMTLVRMVVRMTLVRRPASNKNSNKNWALGVGLPTRATLHTRADTQTM
jgi:hypothetical protein